MWGEAVERWRPSVLAELARSNLPLPADLILAVIHVESRGHAGSTNSSSGASGLMQVMPGTLNWYNQQTGDSISIDQMRSPSHPMEQIRVGIWVLSRFWRSAYNYLNSRLTDIPVDELAKIADLFYVAGPAAAKKKLDRIEVPFVDYVANRYPKWNALPHPQNVWKVLPTALSYDLPAIESWLGGSIEKGRKTREGAILLLAAVAAGYWWFFRKKNSS